ncbi:MAG: hypothetical protein LBP21_03090 [Synergistaceae bacterium]|nr:hypothetical protein [Synergistaceae bacterium]
MPLLTCRLCGKIFTSAGGRTCPGCLDRLDELYPKVREYLRDNPKAALNIETLAEAMGADVRDVQALVDMGYLDRDTSRQVDSEAANRQKLAQEFEKSLKQMKDSSATRDTANNAASYGQYRYGDKNRKR